MLRIIDRLTSLTSTCADVLYILANKIQYGGRIAFAGATPLTTDDFMITENTLDSL